MAFHVLDLKSFYHLKWIKIGVNADGNGTVTIHIADHSVRPLKYRTVKYMEEMVTPLSKKLISLFEEIQTGKYVPNETCCIWQLLSRAREIQKKIDPEYLLPRRDYLYKTDHEGSLRRYIAERYMVPVYLGLPENPDPEFESEFLSRCEADWESIRTSLESEHVFAITSGSRIYSLPGKAVCVDPVRNRLIIGDCDQYSEGRLSDSRGTAIILPDGSSNDLEYFVLGEHSQAWFSMMTDKYPQLHQLQDIFQEGAL